jgi:hypothetical protein
MGYVAVAVGFAALGAYRGRDLSGGTGLVLFIGAFACILGLNIAAAKGREQIAIGLPFGPGLLLGLAVAPDRASNAVFGVLVIASSLAAFLAPPFTGLDTLPSLGVVLLSLGVCWRTSRSWSSGMECHEEGLPAGH